MRKKAKNFGKIIDPEKVGFLPELKGLMCCTIVEDTSILIENGGEIIVFNDKLIIMERGESRFSIRGENLAIHEMGAFNITVSGKFNAIEYEKGAKE